MSDEKVVISEKSLIPVSLLITIIGVVYWLSSLDFKATANTREINDLKVEYKLLQKINSRLSRIEGALNIKDGDNK